MMQKTITFLSLLILLVCELQSQTSDLYENVRIEFPEYTVQSIPYEVQIHVSDHYTGEMEFVVNDNIVVVQVRGGQGVIELEPDRDAVITSPAFDQTHQYSPRPIPLWWSIFPPLVAIGLALIFREVVTSIFFGVFFGSAILYIYTYGPIGILYGLMHTIDKYILNALTDSGHISIILFSMLIGGTVAVISKNGGMQGIVSIISARAKSPKSGQLATWLMGIVIFFDDYANTLVVGNTMRPVTDKLRISREKLAYIVDSTAAPVAAIAFVTTWIGAELGYIESGIKSLETLNEGVYATFLLSLQYSFYPIFALAFILFLIIQNKDFGPMYHAEKRARTTGEVSTAITQTTLDKDDLSEFIAKKGVKIRGYNAVVPILIIILGTIGGLLYTGWKPEIWQQENQTLGFKLSETIGGADSYLALLWSSLGGLIAAVGLSVGQKIMDVPEVIRSTTSGFKTMLDAVIILTLAWSLAEVTSDLHTAEFLTRLLSDNIAPVYIPVITFLMAALVAFSTGSSWGTMAILYPLILPATWIMTEAAGFEYQTGLSIFHNVVACVLAGSVLGDHCSPISDTTILSSLASSCHHIDHVRTQMPYALVVGATAILFGIIPAAFGVSSWLLFPMGLIVLYFIVRFFGKPIPPSPATVDADQISNTL